MRAATCLAITGVMTAGVALGQHTSEGRVRIVTVCEILSNLTRYTDTAIAVVGRMERSASLSDHSEFLTQDHCERPVVTNGHTWSNRIQIWPAREAGMPQAPSARPRLNRATVAKKLSILRKSTPLGSHEEPRFKADAHSIVYSNTATVPNEWTLVYGRIAAVAHLNEDCGAGGCGGDNVPLVIIAEPCKIRTLEEDATPLPQGR